MHAIATTSYQTIAKRAVGDANFENDEMYMALIQTTRQSFEELTPNAQLAIEAAFVFSRKAPHSERQDLFQELLTAVLASGTEKADFAYAIVRRDWQNWYESYKLHSQFHEGYLSETITNAETGQETELSELLVGEIEFERKQIDKLDAEQLWQQLPSHIQKLVSKRIQGKPLGVSRKKAGQPKSAATLNSSERSTLNRWVQTEGFKLLVN